MPTTRDIAPSRPPSSQMASELVPGSKPRLVLLYHPDRWECTGGEVLPELGHVSAIPGCGGNGPGDRVHPTGALAAVRARGWREVPEDIEFTCWGAKRKPVGAYPTYLDHYDATGGSYWCEAWCRPRVVGGRVTMRHDVEGKRAFQRALVKRLHLEADDVAVELALREPLVAAQGYLPYADQNPNAEARLRQVLAQIPPEHIPQEMRRFMAEKPSAA